MLTLCKESHLTWSEISKQFKNQGFDKSGKQLRRRWVNWVDPSLKNSELNESDEDKIFELYHKLGPKWTEIASLLGNRSENNIKNFFYCNIKKIQKILKKKSICSNIKKKQM